MQPRAVREKAHLCILTITGYYHFRNSLTAFYLVPLTPAFLSVLAFYSQVYLQQELLKIDDDSLTDELNSLLSVLGPLGSGPTLYAQPDFLRHDEAFAQAKHVLMLFSTLRFLSSFLLVLEVLAQIPPPAETFRVHPSLPSYHLCIPPAQWFSSVAACWDHRGASGNTSTWISPQTLFNLGVRLGLGLA